jgi:hypothetical protein
MGLDAAARRSLIGAEVGVIALSAIVALVIGYVSYHRGPDRVFPDTALDGCYAFDGASAHGASIAARVLTIGEAKLSITPLMEIKDRYYFYTSPSYQVTPNGISAVPQGTEDSNYVAFVNWNEQSHLHLQFIALSGKELTATRHSCG